LIDGEVVGEIGGEFGMFGDQAREDAADECAAAAAEKSNAAEDKKEDAGAADGGCAPGRKSECGRLIWREWRLGHGCFLEEKII
jgi:hypothetical protein